MSILSINLYQGGPTENLPVGTTAYVLPNRLVRVNGQTVLPREIIIKEILQIGDTLSFDLVPSSQADETGLEYAVSVFDTNNSLIVRDWVTVLPYDTTLFDLIAVPIDPDACE